MNAFVPQDDGHVVVDSENCVATSFTSTVALPKSKVAALAFPPNVTANAAAADRCLKDPASVRCIWTVLSKSARRLRGPWRQFLVRDCMRTDLPFVEKLLAPDDS